MVVPGLAAAPRYIILLSNYTPLIEVDIIARQDDWQLFMGDI